MTPAFVEKKLGKKRFKELIDDAKVRGGLLSGKVYDLKNSPHICSR